MGHPTVNICALITCHNRRESTLNCLDHLFRQVGLNDAFSVNVILVDDGSIDGTSDAVAEKFPSVEILKGDGKLYWGGGTHMAFRHALEKKADFFLLLNDDTSLYDDALKGMLATYRLKEKRDQCEPIVVGSTCSPETELWTYGGLVKKSGWHPFRYLPVRPNSKPLTCDTMNGNCVLISRSVVDIVGITDKRFTHGFGDIDYGLRARASKCLIWVAPGFVGECDRNDSSTNHDSAELPITQRIKALKNVKGLPINESLYFSKKHGGFLWPILWLLPIVRTILFPTQYKKTASKVPEGLD